VRNDSGCYEGAEIPVHYDPMISKLVVWGEDRKAALQRMRRALDEYAVRGIETNLAFHRRCFRHAAFVAGDYDTGFIARNAAELAPKADDAELTAAIIAAALEAATESKAAARPVAQANGTAVAHPGTSEISGWRRQIGW
jgi:acetyl/propionyl-CoA carboxylase alpha subunit